MNNKEQIWSSFFDGLEKEQFTQALAALQKLIHLDPENPQIYLKMGDLFLRIKDNDKAVKSYYMAARILETEGFKNKALALFKMISRIDPDNSLVVSKLNEAVADAFKADSYICHKKSNVFFCNALPSQTEISLFKSLPLSEIEELRAESEVLFFQKCSMVVKEEDNGDSLYVVKRGNLKVVTHFMDKAVELGSLSEGDIFGEITFLTGRPRTASVIAASDVEIMEIKKPLIKELTKKHPQVSSVLRGFYESRVQEII